MNERLKSAVSGVEPPRYLDARVRSQLRPAMEASFFRSARFAAVAATVVVCAGLTVAYQLGHLRFTEASEDSYIVSISNQVATIMRAGLSDHVKCATFRKYPKDIPNVEQLNATIAPELRGLIPIVQQHAPSGYQMMMAHRCNVGGRIFVHLALRKEDSLLSLVIAPKKDGESFRTEGLIPALQQAGIPVYQSGVQSYQIAAFETEKYLVYAISDLGRHANSEMLVALGPQIRDYLARL